MKSLKMLPWIARQAGVSEERAEELWAEAVCYATEKVEWVGTPEYWKVAVNRMGELAEVERSRHERQGRWPYSLIMKWKRPRGPRPIDTAALFQ